VGDVGDDDSDWISGEDADIGRPNGMDIDIRRWSASFWAASNMYFCTDSFLLNVGLVEGAIVKIVI
jgi:hypothetical protein